MKPYMKPYVCGLCLSLSLSWLPLDTVWADYTVGVRGDSVKEIQLHLKKAGIRIDTDGVYGTKTALAVKAFQKKHKLKADGVVGPVTYTVLLGKKMPVDDPTVTYTNAVFPKDDSLELHIDKKDIRELISEAKKYIGTPYTFGGTTPKGFDCSGFMQYVFSRKGIHLPRSADQQYGKGKTVQLSRLQPGDMVFFTTYASGVSHSGLYLGNGEFISATTSCGVRIDTLKSGYWHDCYIGAKRIL